MTTQHENNAPSQLTKSSQRTSGRVGVLFKRDASFSARSNEGQLQEMQKLYQRLMDLRDRDESELTKAISYGMKLLAGPSSKTGSFESHLFSSGAKVGTFEAMKS